MFAIFLALLMSVMYVFPAELVDLEGYVPYAHRVGYKRKFQKLNEMSHQICQQDAELLGKLPALAAYRERPRPNKQNCEESAVLCCKAQAHHSSLVLFRIRNFDIPLVVKELKAKQYALASIYRTSIQQSLDAIPEWARDKEWQAAKKELPQRTPQELEAERKREAEKFAAQCLVADQLNQEAAELSGREFCVEFVPHQQ